MNGDTVVFDIANTPPEIMGQIFLVAACVVAWIFTYMIWLRLRRDPRFRLIGNIYLALTTLGSLWAGSGFVASMVTEREQWPNLTQVANQEQWAQTRGTARVTSDPELDRPGIPAGSIQVLAVGDHRFEVGLYSKNSRVRDELIREVDGEPVILYFHEHLILRIERDTGEVERD